MSNDTYNADILAPTTATVTIDEIDGIGLDWLVVNGSYPVATDIRLSWWSENGTSTQASARFDPIEGQGHRLVINGLIENVRGSNTTDFIQGNEVANILYGDAAATGPGGNDTISGFDGNDSIYGGAGSDVINGDSGNDRLYGGAGADSLNGGSGRDLIIGGGGADVMYGGADGNDTLSYAGSSVGVTVALTFGGTTNGVGGDAQGDVIGGFSDIIGSAGSDRLTDTVKTAVASGGNNNSFYGGLGNDTLYLGGGVDDGHGGVGNDALWGEVGNDLLYGDDGNDMLVGGIGADRLWGGLGADQFVFRTTAETTTAALGRDSVQDFNRIAGDKIDLRTLDADSSVALNQAFTYIGTAAFDGRHGLLHATVSGANLLVTGDINGDKVADFSILVANTAALIASDFLL